MEVLSSRGIEELDALEKDLPRAREIVSRTTGTSRFFSSENRQPRFARYEVPPGTKLPSSSSNWVEAVAPRKLLLIHNVQFEVPTRAHSKYTLPFPLFLFLLPSSSCPRLHTLAEATGRVVRRIRSCRPGRSPNRYVSNTPRPPATFILACRSRVPRAPPGSAASGSNAGRYADARVVRE